MNFFFSSLCANNLLADFDAPPSTLLIVRHQIEVRLLTINSRVRIDAERFSYLRSLKNFCIIFSVH